MIQIPASAAPDIQEAFRQVSRELFALNGDQNIDLHGRRIINAGAAVDDADYVTKAVSTTVVNPVGFVTAGVNSITGTASQVSASTPQGNVTLSLPQSIATTSTVRFGVVGVGLAASGNGVLQAKAGNQSTHIAKVGGAIVDHFADAANSGTGETDLYSDSLTGAILNTNGDKILAQYGGIFAGSATSTQTLRVYFGGTKIFDSGALSIGAVTDSFDVWATMIRVSASVVRCLVGITTNFATLNASATYTEVTGLTLTNAQIVKITGQAGGVGGGSSQIVAKQGFIEWLSAA